MSSRSKSTQNQVRDARTQAWTFVFDCYAKKNAAAGPGGKDAMKGSENDRAGT
jgi:hypothetical protein